MQLILPFSAKELANGKKLYRRKHGYMLSLSASGNTTHIITVPYNHAKINEAEILWAPEGVCVNMIIKDSTVGPYKGIPNAVLSQYGSNVVVAKDLYVDTSPYDADVYLNMQIEFTFTNASATSKNIGINIVFHEVV